MTTTQAQDEAWKKYAETVKPCPITAQIKNAWISGYEAGKAAAVKEMEVIVRECMQCASVLDLGHVDFCTSCDEKINGGGCENN
jgi:hypothetical protein